jgi:hypothetical protein
MGNFMITRSLVLCRYNENIEWIKKFEQSNLKIFLYDKGEENNFNQSNLYATTLDNVGREAHAYFYHIVKNYDVLTDQVYFAQAYPFPHIPNYIEDLHSQLQKDTIDGGFKWVGPKIHNDLFDNLDYGSDRILMPNGHPNPYKRSIKNIYENIFDEKCPNIDYYYVSGCFFVEKNNILSHPIEKYQKLLEIVSYTEQKKYQGFWKSNCIEAHFLERMYEVIFKNV